MKRKRYRIPSPTEHALTAFFAAACFALFLFHLYFVKAPVLTSLIGSTAVTILCLTLTFILQRRHTRHRDLALTRKLSQLTPAQFEQVVAALFRADGYKATVSGGANDRGIDITLEKDDEKAVVQCKRYQQKITPAQIRDFIGAMNGRGVEVGYFVTSSGFTKAAKEAAALSSYRLHLIHGRELGRWQRRVQAQTAQDSAKKAKVGKVLALATGTILVWSAMTGVIYEAGMWWVG